METSVEPPTSEVQTILTVLVNPHDGILKDIDKSIVCNLSETNLMWLQLPQESQLNGVNLSHANLRHAYLRKVCLRNANLSDANLTAADLSDADLTGADLTGAILNDVIVDDANLKDVKGLPANFDEIKYHKPKI